MEPPAQAAYEEDTLAVVTMKNLLESGVHFGHQTRRWDPRMKKFIFAERNGIHIIDLQKTIAAIKEAYDVVRKTVLEGKSILFIGTKKQAQQAIEEEAKRCGMFFVNKCGVVFIKYSGAVGCAESWEEMLPLAVHVLVCGATGSE